MRRLWRGSHEATVPKPSGTPLTPSPRPCLSRGSSRRSNDEESVSRVSFHDQVQEEEIPYSPLVAVDDMRAASPSVGSDSEEPGVNDRSGSRISSLDERSGGDRSVRFGGRPSATWSLEAEAIGRRSSKDDLPKRQQSSRPSLFSWRCYQVIDPRNSSWLHRWDVVNAVLLLAIALVWPYETAFLVPELNLLFVFNCVCDVALIVDMIMQFFVAYPDPLRPERVVRSHKSILVNYLKGWFFFDLLSVLPVDLICTMVRTPQERQGAGRVEAFAFKLLEDLRILRLMRLVRFWHLFERWQTSFGVSYAKMTLMKLMATLVLCCHWLACLWGAMAFGAKDDETNWLSALKVAKGGPHISPDDHLSTYSLALYWAIITITSIGYGDITPQTMTEYHVATVCSTVMASIWAYVIGAICGIVSTLDQHEISWKRTMDDLNWFMEDKDMPTAMRTRLRRYFHEAKEMKKQTVEKEVITQMSPLLQGEVSMFMHSRWISKVWYLRDMNREIIVWAARNLTLAVFAPGEEVLDERTLFIVQRGVCSFKGRILVSGDIWGEDMLLSNPYLREQSKARAMSHLAVLTLHIADLFEVVVCFAEARARLRWAQIQIATMRGVIRIAKKLKAMRTRGLNTWELSEEKRVTLYRDILQGQTGDDDDIAISPHTMDFFDVHVPGVLGPSRRNSFQRDDSQERLDGVEEAICTSHTMVTDRGHSYSSERGDIRDVLLELQQSVEEMKRSLSPATPSFKLMLGGSTYKEISKSRGFNDSFDIGPMASEDLSKIMSNGKLQKKKRDEPRGMRASLSRMIPGMGHHHGS